MKFNLLASKGKQNGDIGKETESDNRPVHEDEAVLSHRSYPEHEHKYLHTNI